MIRSVTHRKTPMVFFHSRDSARHRTEFRYFFPERGELTICLSEWGVENQFQLMIREDLLARVFGLRRSLRNRLFPCGDHFMNPVNDSLMMFSTTHSVALHKKHACQFSFEIEPRDGA